MNNDFSNNSAWKSYTNIQKIFQGGQAILYKATNSKSNKDCCIKRYQINTLSLIERSRIDNEIKILRSLKHKNIVKLLDVIDDGNINLIFDYIEGASLHDIIRYQFDQPDKLAANNEIQEIYDFIIKNQRSENLKYDLQTKYRKEKCSRVAVRHPLFSDANIYYDRLVESLMEQLTTTLLYLEKKNVIHRDIKPQNIMVTPQLHLFLLDFGFATFDENSAEQLGTDCYFCVEMLQDKYYSVLSNNFQLGCVWFKLLTGSNLCLPYKEENEKILKLNLRLSVNHERNQQIQQLTECEPQRLPLNKLKFNLQILQVAVSNYFYLFNLLQTQKRQIFGDYILNFTDLQQHEIQIDGWDVVLHCFLLQNSKSLHFNGLPTPKIYFVGFDLMTEIKVTKEQIEEEMKRVGGEYFYCFGNFQNIMEKIICEYKKEKGKRGKICGF